MAILSINRNELIGLTSLSFIRPQSLTFSVTNVKPFTRLYAFFNSISVDRYISASNITDSNGAMSGTFNIPPLTFNTGSKVLSFQDTPVYDSTPISGSSICNAQTTFYTNGLEDTYQKTLLNNDIVSLRNVPSLKDPIAQSFFTYGINGGCFITKIDVWFQTSDSTIPILLEVRNFVNGSPGNTLVSAYSLATVNASVVSANVVAEIATSFIFSQPIYLEENKDYCFVLQSNSSKYNIFTSKFGDLSLETQKTIFEQPYVGSMFKLENNNTWTEEKTEDIKFIIYKAVFSPSANSYPLVLDAVTQPVLIYGSNLTVTNDSSLITVNLSFQHGLKDGDNIKLTGITSGEYRGISDIELCNVSGHSVTVLDDPKSFTFSVAGHASSTGNFNNSGVLRYIAVDEGGSGYSSVVTISNTLGFSAPASAVATVDSAGKILYITVTAGGSGYPDISSTDITLTGGNGAVVYPSIEAIFTLLLPRKFQSVIPQLSFITPPGTKISTQLKTTNFDSAVVEESNVETYKLNLLQKKCRINSIIGNTQLTVNMSSTNSNVSPIVDISEKAGLQLNNYLVSDINVNDDETTARDGISYARYISKIVTIGTISTAVKVFVNAASIVSNNISVYIRTSMAVFQHSDLNWVKLECTVPVRNLSTVWDEYIDYEFYKDAITGFDTFDIKIILNSSNQAIFPKIANYRTIVLLK
jgi:hypothetical protein